MPTLPQNINLFTHWIQRTGNQPDKIFIITHQIMHMGKIVRYGIFCVHPYTPPVKEITHDQFKSLFEKGIIKEYEFN